MIRFDIMSKTEAVSSGTAESIILPTETGIVGILSGHAEAFFLVSKGDILIKNKKGKNTTIKILGKGIAYIKNDNLLVAITQ